MGSCICIHSKKFVIDNKSKKENILKSKLKNLYVESCRTKNYKQNYFNKTTISNWMKILDFLKFRDLKEASKVNSTLNSIAKSQKILVKFFKNRAHTKKFNSTITQSLYNYNLPDTNTNFNIYYLNQKFIRSKFDNSTFNNNKNKKSFNDDDSFFHSYLDKKPRESIFKKSLTSNFEDSKYERRMSVFSNASNNDNDNENKIKLLNSHKITIYSLPSDSMTPSFAIDSALDSSYIDKSSKHSNRLLFRTFGSHNTKISQAMNELHQNENQSHNLKIIAKQASDAIEEFSPLIEIE